MSATRFLSVSICTCLALLAAGCASTQSPRDRAGYTQAEPDPGFLRDYAQTYRFRLGTPSAVTPTPDGEHILYLRSPSRSFVKSLYEFDVRAGVERTLLTAEQILGVQDEELTKEELARRERMRDTSRGIASFQLSDDGERILVPLSGRIFIIERVSGLVLELESDAGYPLDPQMSPDGAMVACVRNGDLYVTEIESREEVRLTFRSSGTVTNGLSEFVAQEEMGRSHGYWWSPDSKRIAYQRTDVDGLETMHIADAVSPETAPDSWPYPRPGMTNADVQLGVISAFGGATTWAEWDRKRYEYLNTVKWEEDGPLTIVVQNRRQTEQAVLEVDEATGYTQTLLTEQDDAWVDIVQEMPHWLPGGKSFLWMTERNGAWQLELRARDGSLVREITPLDLGLRKFVHYQLETRELIVTASPDPTQAHIYRVPLDADRGGPRRRTSQSGEHRAIFGDAVYTRVHQMRHLDGRMTWEVFTQDGNTGFVIPSVAESPRFDVNLELTTVGHRPSLHAAIVRPRNFDGKKRYPVIVHVYGGPTSTMVRANARAYFLDQWFADHGFIVVRIDGRGTPNRGREWGRVVKDNLIDIPLQDQVAGLQALGRKYPELDMKRVGIWGWSFGGYFSAMAVMREPNVFHAGVAGAPVNRWEDYDTHYTERYMDLPQINEVGYLQSAVSTYAERLERPLLIMHGTADDNVYFMHALKISKALFEAGKHHEFLPLIGFTHMVPDPNITTRLYSRILEFFETNLAEDAERVRQRGGLR